MNFGSLFKFGSGLKAGSSANVLELPDIFPFSIASNLFIQYDIESTYTNILTDTAERTSGLSSDEEDALWDSCLQGDAGKGLITLLAEAMFRMTDLYLVWNVGGSGVLRKATSAEQHQIREDYREYGESKLGVYISFHDYKRTRMLKIWSALEYCLLVSLHKTMNVSRALQIKINDLRKSIADMDGEEALSQGKDIANALRDSRDVMLDKADEITTTSPDTAASEKSLEFLTAKKAHILRLPASYVDGEQTGGIGSSGENDMRAIEKGLRHYFVSILKPVFKALFQKEVSFKTEDFRQITSALEVLKAFTIVGTEHLPFSVQIDIIARMFNLDPSFLESELAKQPRIVVPEPDSIADGD